MSGAIPDPAAPERRRALLLVNRHAGNGGVDLATVEETLRAGGMAVETLVFPKKHPIPEAIRSRAAEVDCVIVGGGDGTLHSCASAVLDSGVPLGILPLGTANDLARTLGIGPDPVAAARVIAAGSVRRIDLGEVDGHLFWNVASIGPGPELAEKAPTALKSWLGPFAYAVTSIGLLRRLRPFAADLMRDGRRERVRTLQVSVGNGRHHGGGMTVAADAEPDDGLLHVYSLEVRHWWRLPLLLPALRRGDQGTRPDVRSFSCRELTLGTPDPMPVIADGSPVTVTPATFRIHPRAVTVYAPAPRPPSQPGATGVSPYPFAQ